MLVCKVLMQVLFLRIATKLLSNILRNIYLGFDEHFKIVFEYTVSTIAIDKILIRDIYFLVLILVLTKVVSFHNEAHTFLYQKS